MAPSIDRGALRARLLTHPLYDRLGTLAALRVFLEHHVFAVWDFMSLLKALQRRLTSVEVPWLPAGDPAVRAMINEIVAGEESDPVAGGRSHFEWYLDAMREAGADTGPIERFVSSLRQGASLEKALDHAPAGARPFVQRTLAIALRAPDAVVAAEFTAGREKLVPEMFPALVRTLSAEHPGHLMTLLAYLERHIEVDGGSHGPLAERMVASLIRDDAERARCARGGEEALLARIGLWDAVLEALESRSAHAAAEPVPLGAGT